MSRKGENIYKRKDGRWEGRYVKARNEEGKIIYGYVYGKKYTVVKQRLAEMKVQYITSYGRVTIFEGTLEQWLHYWLNIAIRNRIKVSTYINYQQRIDKYLIPFLGKKKLMNLTNADVRLFINYLTGIGLSPATISAILTVLKSALNQAVAENRLLRNPCENITVKKETSEKINVLNQSEQRKIEKAALKEKECSAVIIALYTGLRIGEISGLMWQDIDFEKNTLSVKRTLYRSSKSNKKEKTSVIIDDPKTKSSKRLLPIAKNLKQYLLEKKAESTSEYVVSCKDKYAEPRVISYRFKKTLADAGVPSIHFHALRHTFATRCVEKGIDIVTVSKLLGHASTKMTLDTYTDSLWESRIQAISLMDTDLTK